MRAMDDRAGVVRHATELFCVFYIAAPFVWTYFARMIGGSEASITSVVRAYTDEHHILIFLLGFGLAGLGWHFFGKGD